MLHNSQGFPTFAVHNAYEGEESSFKGTAKSIALHDVPQDAKVISSHTIYKVKVGEDRSLELKPRMAPHGNKDNLLGGLRSCAMCSLVGTRLLISTTSLLLCPNQKFNVKSAFLHTESAARDIYVISHREPADREKVLWMLLTAAYGLFNGNANLKVMSDALLQ